MTRHIQHASRHLRLLRQSIYSRLSQSKPTHPPASPAIPRTLSTTTNNPNRTPRTQTTHPAQPHQHHQQTTPFSTSAPTMSSDDAYAAFLNSANQPLGHSAETSSSPTSGFHATKTVDEGLSVPRPLVDVGEVYYVSEADEVWEPVVLKWEGEGWPDEEQFKSLIFATPPPSSVASDLSIESLPPSSFDPQNHYAAVMKAVSAATAGGDGGAAAGDVEAVEDKLRVWRVGFGRSRAEYWVLGMEEGAKRIVGMKARAVET